MDPREKEVPFIPSFIFKNNIMLQPFYDTFEPIGPKEVRLNRVRLMDTGRYCEAATYRGETIEDVDAMFSLKVDNVFDAT